MISARAAIVDHDGHTAHPTAICPHGRWILLVRRRLEPERGWTVRLSAAATNGSG